MTSHPATVTVRQHDEGQPLARWFPSDCDRLPEACVEFIRWRIVGWILDPNVYRLRGRNRGPLKSGGLCGGRNEAQEKCGGPKGTARFHRFILFSTGIPHLDRLSAW
jgi:hypothetical protein